MRYTIKGFLTYLKNAWNYNTMNSVVINEIISHRNWDLLILNCNPKDVSKISSYPNAMRVLDELLRYNPYDDDFREFAVNLAFAIRKNHRDLWDLDWKNDIFLGSLCCLTWRYNERYKAYKRAYDKLKDPPDSLLLLLAGCNSAPGTPPISDQESEKYLRRAVEKKITYESALRMRALYRENDDKINEDYWNEMCEDLKKRNIHTDRIVPDIFQKR